MHAKTLWVAGFALAGAAQAAEITIYKQPNFSGGEQTFSRDTANLQGTGVFDQSKSIVVRSGRWQVCSQPDFRGDCQVLERGQYASLPQELNGRIESVREVTQVAEAERSNRWHYDGQRWAQREDWRADRGRGDDRRGDDRRGDGYGGRAAIVLFADGTSTRYDRDVDSFARSPLRDGAESMVIREGRWEICALPEYRGFCRVYEPGRYPNLGRFSSQIGSIRRVG
ncbi:MAG TPA: beta/gamma crystallin-related protein [Usitatibacter sp.]|nr:beta/gamma crystallin-related protein [Usitatibacter sp.]